MFFLYIFSCKSTYFIATIQIFLENNPDYDQVAMTIKKRKKVKKMILTGDSDKKRTIIWMLFSFLYLAALFLTQAMRMWVV